VSERERKRRIAENEVIFRSVNEQLRSLNSTLTTLTDPLQIVCECGTRSCTERIPVALEAYLEVREDPTLFITKPGHDFPETERVESKQEQYWTVRKDPGLPSEIARRAPG
jgi:hypothetical protein